MNETVIIPITLGFLFLVGLTYLLLGVKKRSKMLQRLWVPQGSKSIITKHIFRIAYFSIACACLLVLFTAPHTEKPATLRTAHITLLVDVSKSRAAEMPLGTDNGIKKSKEIIRNICDEFPDIHTSLYAFTEIARSHAYFSQSSSNKHNCGYIRKTLENVLTIESVSKTGTNIADALLVSSASFPPEAESRILILFTDGEYTNQDKEFVQAFSAIKKKGIVLLVVGIGNENGAYIPIYNEKSGQLVDVERDYSGKKIVTALRSETLKAVARETNGKYFGENEKDELFAEIESNLVKKEEPLENFYSPLGLVFATGFFLGGLAFLRSVL